MADTAIIKEFLVKLGFEQDERGLNKFTGGVDRATKNVVKLVAAIQGAALTIGAGVAAFASNLETMYFASIKAGASANNLQAFAKAAQNFGAQSEEALQSVQGLARFMRETPGSEGFIKALGVNTRRANGDLRDTTDIMADLGKELSKKPYYMAKQYGNMLGMSEDTMRAIMNGDFSREVEKQRALLKDSGFDDAAKTSHKFMMQLRELQTYLQLFALKIQEALVKKLGVSMEQMGAWMRENLPMIASRVADVLLMILTLAEKITPAIVWLVDKFIALDEATDGWSTKIIVLLGVLNMLGAGALVMGITSLAAAFGALAIPILAIAGAAGAGVMIGKFINSLLPENIKGGIGEITARTLAALGNDEAQSAVDAMDRAKAGGQSQSGKIRKSKGGEINPLNFFMGLGWTKAQAAGIVANLQHESAFNPRATGDGGKAYGLAQWHPNRQADFKKWSGKDIQGSSAEEQMAFVNYELTQGAEQKAGALLRASDNARQAGQVMSRNYERPMDRAGEAMKRGETAVQIAQTTNISVAGGDASATGRAVAGEQERVNANLTRNLQVAYN